MPRLGYLILAGGALALVIAVFVHRMPQPVAYHFFADQRACLGIPNFFNVASNLAFALTGALALAWMYAQRAALRARFIDPREAWLWVALYVSTFFVTFGSAYYHLAPDNPRLLWDRLPMALTAPAFVAIVCADRFGLRAAAWTGGVLAIASAASLVYWRSTMAPGPDNVWPYFVMLYGSLLCAVIVMLVFRSRYTHAHAAWASVLIYGIAMAFDDTLDETLYAYGQAVSGHSLKHMLAAIALLWLAWGSLRVRRPLAPG